MEPNFTYPFRNAQETKRTNAHIDETRQTLFRVFMGLNRAQEKNSRKGTRNKPAVIQRS